MMAARRLFEVPSTRFVLLSWRLGENRCRNCLVGRRRQLVGAGQGKSMSVDSAC